MKNMNGLIMRLLEEAKMTSGLMRETRGICCSIPLKMMKLVKQPRLNITVFGVRDGLDGGEIFVQVGVNRQFVSSLNISTISVAKMLVFTPTGRFSQ